jgi:hypothetical protein
VDVCHWICIDACQVMEGQIMKRIFTAAAISILMLGLASAARV